MGYYEEKKIIYKQIMITLNSFTWDINKGIKYDGFIKQLKLKTPLGFIAIKNVLDPLIEAKGLCVNDGLIIKENVLSSDIETKINKTE